MYLVGIDVGTTNTKAVVFDAETGQVHATGSCPTITRHPQVEWSEFEAAELWDAVVRSLRQVIQQCERPERIRAVAIASMGEAGFPLDEYGNVLYPAIAWYDPRTAAQSQWWEESIDRKQIYEISGQALHSMFGINKLLWLREHVAVFQRIRHWLSIEDFVLWKLSGNFATDYSIASRTMVFDQRTLAWSETLLKHADIPLDWFPTPFPAGTPIGTVRQNVAQETGLPPHTIVVTGGHDHLCGALAAGVTKPGQLLDSTGTACAILAVGRAFQPGEELLARGYPTYAYVERDTYVTLGGLNFAGGALEWLVTLLYGETTPAGERYVQAFSEAASVPRGSHGALIFPHFLGAGTPYNHEAGQGAMLGLTPSHSRKELMRALMEGLAFWLRDNLEALHALDIAPPRPEITAIGGATRAQTLMQIKAEVMGCRITVPQITEAAATGAALLAGIGAGIFQSGEEAASTVLCPVRTYEPDPQAVEVYNAIYQQMYLPACATLVKPRHSPPERDKQI